MLTACHQSVLSSPPPPRLVGVNTGLAWAWAWRGPPAASSLWAASGAVRPAPTINRVNSRRETAPSLTRAIHDRSSRASIAPPTIGSGPVRHGRDRANDASEVEA